MVDDVSRYIVGESSIEIMNGSSYLIYIYCEVESESDNRAKSSWNIEDES